jgi:hypothetical protein
MAKAFVPIQLDKMRNLRYGMKALSKIEDSLNTPLAKIDMNCMTQRQLATFIWAGLEHEDKELTPDSVMDLIDDYSDIQVVADLLTKAITASMGVSQTPQGKSARGK